MMNFAQLKQLTIPEGEVKKITSGADVLWEMSSYTNQVPLSIDSSGNIYNGVGYKNGYRIRSGGAEGAVTAGACTGFIKVNPGDVIRISGCSFSADESENAINIANSSFTNLGQMAMNSTWGYGDLAGDSEYGMNSCVVEETTGVWKWNVPPASYGVAYIRVSGHFPDGADGAKLIVTINEEIS